jgi:hypothetical protein
MEYLDSLIRNGGAWFDRTALSPYPSSSRLPFGRHGGKGWV